MFSKFSEIANSFNEAGFEFYAVGGCVRDSQLGISSNDFDFTTDALGKEIEKILKPFASAMNVVGKTFGTIGAMVDADWIEVTTFRKEIYRKESRKPEVTFSTTLEEDLIWRDFTVNSMAYDILKNKLIDPFGGLEDLKNKILRTPQSAEKSFSDDPLRMLRAARFMCGFELTPTTDVIEGIAKVKSRLSIVSKERIRDELCKLLVVKDPTAGLWFLSKTKLSDEFFPELNQMKMEQDPIQKHKDVLAHSIAVVKNTDPELLVRLAALFHDIAKPATRKITENGVSFHHHEVVGAKMTRIRMKELKFSSDLIQKVSKLVFLHLRIHTFSFGWTDSAVRRYVRDAGELLDELNHLQRCDCTTRNPRRAAELQRRMDDLEDRIADLKKKEELDSIKPDIDGDEIMSILDLKPGKDVGMALKHLTEIRLDKGQLTKAEWKVELLEWAKDNLKQQ